MRLVWVAETEAVWLALLACGGRPGDEVIRSRAPSWQRLRPLLIVGAKPVFVDVDERTYTMDPRALPNVLTSRTKAIVPVHLFWPNRRHGSDSKVCGQHGLVVVEDAAQSTRRRI